MRDTLTARYQPASTFKIANALIALDAKAVSSIDEIIPYGGTKEYFKNWERDMNLKQAMKASNVAVFHQVARRIGMETMTQKLKSFDYGNADPGQSIDDRFWLTGPLAISAMEQVDFLRRFVSGTVAANAKSVKQTKSLLIHETKDDYTIFAKTGWVGPNAPQIGWWVGWVKRENQVCCFALNIDIKESSDAPKRLIIGKACLKELGWIE